MQISFKEAFETLSALTDALPDITGVDIWRRTTGNPSLADIAPQLHEECVSPPSKLQGQYTGNKNSVWHAIHFTLLMPALQELGTRAETKELQRHPLSSNQASQAFGAFPTLKSHIDQYQEWKDRLPQILNNLPSEPCELNEELRPFFEGELKENPDNHPVGRLLQAYYIQNNQRYRLNGAPREIAAYLENSKGLFDRTQLYIMNRLQHCPLPLNDDGKVKDEVSAIDLLKTYSWFACPTVVEMVLPNLQGAAAKAAISLTAFLETLHTETGQDLRSFEISPQTMSALQNDEQLLWRFERMGLMLSTLGNEQAAERISTLDNKIWTKEQRRNMWDNLPDIQAPESPLYGIILHAHTMDI